MRLIHGGLHHTSSNPIRSKTLSSSPPLRITPMGDVCCPPLYFVLQFIVSRRASEVTNHKSTVSAHSRVQQQPSHTRADAVLYIHTPSLSHTASSQETLSSNTGTYKANIRRKNKSIHSLCSSRTDSQDLKSNQTNKDFVTYPNLHLLVPNGADSCISTFQTVQTNLQPQEDGSPVQVSPVHQAVLETCSILYQKSHI